MHRRQEHVFLTSLIMLLEMSVSWIPKGPILVTMVSCKWSFTSLVSSSVVLFNSTELSLSYSLWAMPVAKTLLG